MIPNLIGFGLSFYVVGRYWLPHHRPFDAVETYDRRLKGEKWLEIGPVCWG